MTDHNSSFLCKLRESETGNIAPLMAAGMFVLSGLVGGGVDMSRAYMTQNRLQNACDAGVIAGRKAVATNGFDTAAQAAASSYFNTNFGSAWGVSGITFTPTTPNNGSTIEGAASASINATIMRIFGFTSIPLSVTCSATMQVSNSDITMVIDTTGSMSWAISGSDPTIRMTALQNSMNSFYSTINSATAGTNARIRFGFVPYSSSVNVGAILKSVDSSYLAETTPIQSKEPQYIDVEIDTDQVAYYKDPVTTTSTSRDNYSATNWTDYAGSYSYWGCIGNRPSDTSWTDTGSATTTTNSYTDANDNQVSETVTTKPQSRTEYRCYRKSWGNYWVQSRTRTADYILTEKETREPVYVKQTVKTFDRFVYKQVEYNTSGLRSSNYITTPTGADGADETITWNGCIEERDTVATGSIYYTPFFGLTPSDAYDVDINLVPNSNATRWKPLLPQLSYVRTNSYGNATNADESDYGVARTEYCPIQSELLATKDAAQFSNFVSSLTTVGATYHDIGMIWGARMASPSGPFSSNVTAAPTNGGNVARHIVFLTDGDMDTSQYAHTAWGIEYHDRRVTSNGSSYNDDRHDRRLLAACAAAKDEGIRVWVIAFATALTTSLESCASPNSSFTAANSAGLDAAFQDIANQVGELRIVQ